MTSTVEPWFYARRETVVELEASEEERAVLLYNNGRRVAIPVLTVEQNVYLIYNGFQVQLPAGSYEWPDFALHPGRRELKYSGTGALTITYREAVLR